MNPLRHPRPRHGPTLYLKILLRRLRRSASVRRLVLGLVAGTGSGLLASAFFFILELLRQFLLVDAVGLTVPSPGGEHFFYHAVAGTPRLWLLPLLLGGVGMATGYVFSRLIPESLGSGTDGTDAMIKAFHRQSGVIRPRVFFLRATGAILTMAAGGSAGSEGPMSQLGGGMGSFLAMKLGLSARERRILLLAGAAGGLGAIFRAPLGGALTAVEVVYREDFEAEAVLPAVVSSVTAYTIMTLFFGTGSIFTAPAYHFRNVLELPVYAFLGLFCSGAAFVYLRTFFFFKHRVFERLQAKIGLMWTAGIGGLCMGGFGALFPQTLSSGYGWLEMAIRGDMGPVLLAALFLGKTLATSLTLGSGLSGGMFAPTLFAGGVAGGIVGQVGHRLLPDVVATPGSYTLVGMAAMFAGVAGAPVGPLIMVCEITQGYGLLAPLMLCTAVCLVLCRRTPLYENQVANKFESPAHLGDATINILEELRVQDYYRAGKTTILERGTTLKALTDIIAGTTELVFPVRDAAGRLSGVLTMQDVRNVLFENALFDLVVVGDLARPPVSLTPDASLYDALLLFVDENLGQIPVVDPENQDTVLGMLGREDVFSAYSATLKELKKEG
ncbi:MAG: chloride channel protein [Thermodesulfobacteriota bacterium]